MQRGAQALAQTPPQLFFREVDAEAVEQGAGGALDASDGALYLRKSSG